jgi:phospholipase/carboxylesterase
MVPRRGIELPKLEGAPVLIAAGTNDPLCSPQESIELEKLLSEAGASVTLHWEDYGHQLTSSEVEAAANWFREQWPQD